VWAVLAVLTALGWAGGLALLPVIEGGGAVATAAGLRLAQSALGRLACWGVLVAGGGAWGLAVERAVAVTVLGLAALAGRDALARRWREGGGERLSFRDEVVPLAWRTGLATIGGFAPWAIAVPGALVWLGAAEAGRLGLGLAILGSFATVWDGVVQARVPMLAMRAARGEHAAADRDWLRTAGAATAGFVVCGAAFALAVQAWGAGAFAGADRIPTGGEAWLLMAGASLRFVRGQALVWARSHKREPFWFIDVAGGLACVGLVPLAARAGMVPLIGAWLAVDALVLLATLAGARAFVRAGR
jgi:hypothetical protein